MCYRTRFKMIGSHPVQNYWLAMHGSPIKQRYEVSINTACAIIAAGKDNQDCARPAFCMLISVDAIYGSKYDYMSTIVHYLRLKKLVPQLNVFNTKLMLYTSIWGTSFFG